METLFGYVTAQLPTGLNCRNVQVLREELTYLRIYSTMISRQLLRRTLSTPRAFFSGTSSNNNSSSWRSPGDFGWFFPVQTRWRDNDVYGHVNNAVFVSYFDTAINVYLMNHCGQDFIVGHYKNFMVRKKGVNTIISRVSIPLLLGAHLLRLLQARGVPRGVPVWTGGGKDRKL